MLEGLLSKLLFHGRDIEEVKRNNPYIPNKPEFNPNAPYLEDVLVFTDELDLSDYNTNIGLDKIRQPIAEMREFNGRMLEKVRNSFNDYKESGELSKLGKGLAYAVGITVAISPLLIIGVMGCDLSMDNTVDGGDLIEDIPQIDSYEVEAVQELDSHDLLSDFINDVAYVDSYEVEAVQELDSSDLLETMEEEICQQVVYYADHDGDNYIDINDFIVTCFGANVPDNYITGEFNGMDCNDYDSKVYPGATEICDNLDNDCDLEVDDGLTLEQACGETDIGECTLGFIYNLCTAGEYIGWSKCDAVISQPEVCDGLDNDCDNDTDEDLILEQVCGETDIGECNLGFVYNLCTAGEYTGWSECVAVVPQAEVCDGLDNDCDNEVDEDLTLEQSCGETDIGECNLGFVYNLCTAGEYTGWSECDAVVSQPEVCDGLDNNCDGDIDEGLTLEQVCGSDVGECTYGLISNLCIGGMYLGWSECDSVNSLPEVCDGKDNDCDGEVDEELTIQQLCGETDVGECTYGIMTNPCIGGNYIGFTECDAVVSQPEVCDGLDNNCDGQIDEGLTLEQVCGSDVGECTYGLISNLCIGGMYLGWSECDSVNSLPEVCDGLDNDCDGEVDEELTLEQVCGETDIGECTLGFVYNLCTAGEYTGWSECDAVVSQPEVCDGLDNNCDNEIDEGLTLEQVCGETDIGECTYGLITNLCVGGMYLGWSECDAVNSLPEVCDGLDNNCDGEVDEDLTLEQVCGETDIGECTYGLISNLCVGGMYLGWSECDAIVSKAEECDGLDNDCDNEIDEEGCVPVVCWDKTFDGKANDIQQTNDGGYIIGGRKSDKAWVLKLDKDGNNIGDFTFSGSGDTEFDSIQQTSDGGYIAAGHKGGFNLWVSKINQEGTEEWGHFYAGELGYSVKQTSDSGYIVTGKSGPYLSLLKIKPNGEQDWNELFGNGVGRSVIETNDGNYVVSNSNARIFKVSPDGKSIIWDYNNYGSGDLRSIIETNDGGLIAAGKHETNTGWVLKLDSEGIETGSYYYNASSSDIAFSIFQTDDNGYIVGGATQGQGPGKNDFWIFKIDQGGKQLWQKTYGGGGLDLAYSAQQTTDLGFIIAGYTTSQVANAWVLKLDENGELCD
jgi:hypothetical protein